MITKTRSLHWGDTPGPAQSRKVGQIQIQIQFRVLQPTPGARAVPLHHDRANITQLEEDAFWAWAIVETLRHTGIRIEELLELTQLSLRHYTPASTNTLVPLLHIVPSKTDTERLIPMSPELVTVLLAVQRRAKNGDAHLPALGALRPPREDPWAAATAPVRPPRRHPPRGHFPVRRPQPAQRHRRLGRPHR